MISNLKNTTHYALLQLKSAEFFILFVYFFIRLFVTL